MSGLPFLVVSVTDSKVPLFVTYLDSILYINNLDWFPSYITDYSNTPLLSSRSLTQTYRWTILRLIYIKLVTDPPRWFIVPQKGKLRCNVLRHLVLLYFVFIVFNKSSLWTRKLYRLFTTSSYSLFLYMNFRVIHYSESLPKSLYKIRIS